MMPRCKWCKKRLHLEMDKQGRMWWVCNKPKCKNARVLAVG